MNSLVFTVCIAISGLVSASVVLYYAKRNPNPYFRPKKGELVMMSIFLGIISFITSFVFSQFFEADVDLKRIAEQEERKRKENIQASPRQEAARESSSSSGNGSNTGGSFSDSQDDLPPFLRGKTD